MFTNEQARALMMRHHHIVKNRQQSMLERSAKEIGLDEVSNTGKVDPSLREIYDRSNASLS